jgi:hypothetical protein
MTKLIYQLMNCQNNQEVNDLINGNIDFLNDNPKMFSFVKNARKRINRIRREKMKTWNYMLN